MGVGKYLNVHTKTSIKTVWNNLMSSSGVDTNSKPNLMSDFNVSPEEMKKRNDDKELFVQIKNKFRFVINKYDMALVILYTMDDKGLA
jgi:methyl coenzyme M reductase subunit C